jgi:hypothetical protein
LASRSGARRTAGNPLDAGTLAVADDDTATYTSDMGIYVEFRRADITEAPFTCE